MSEKPKFSVVETIYESNSRDIPATMRHVADLIESGEFGYVGEAAFVLMGDTVEVFGWGEVQDGCTTAVLLQAGASLMIDEVKYHGRPKRS
jgi:hypothetical protein